MHWIIKKAREFWKNIYFCIIDYVKLWIMCVNHNKLWKILENLPLEKSICRSRSNSLNWTWNNKLVPNRERSTSRLYIVTCLFDLYAEYIMRKAGLEEAQAGIKTAG